MNKQQTHSQCDSEKLNALLLGSLSRAEAAAVESHLSECTSCAKQIQLAAVPGTSWNEAESMLAPDEFDGLPSLSAASSLFPAEVDNREYTPTADLLRREIRGWLDPTDDPQMLGRFAGYEIVGIIGHGGMGIVLKGFEASLNRYVAIKVLAPRLATNGAARQRFAREAQAAAAVLHDNVVAIHRVDEFHGLPFLVMPYIADVSLQKRINDQGPLRTTAVLRIGSQIAAGLAAAHHQGLVHRDIKPANIMLEEGVERVTITDFGLARTVDDAAVTRTGVIAGTPQYMSPEQARGESVDQRSDLFSLGSVLYAMCTGRPPFRADTSYGVFRRVTDEEPRPIRETNPEIPEWLCHIIAGLMSKQLDDRFESAREVAELLEECLAHVQQPNIVPLPQRACPPPSPASNPRGRSPLFKLLLGAAFVFTFIFAGLLIVLELNKGTLTIESDADNVPVRITRGDKVVEKLAITRTGASVRIAAGQYIVEIDGQTDGITVKNGTVELQRGGHEVVRIVKDDHAPAFKNIGNGRGEPIQEEMVGAGEGKVQMERLNDGTIVIRGSAKDVRFFAKKINEAEERRVKGSEGARKVPGTVDSTRNKAEAQPAREHVYTCSMHPQIQQIGPGNCPICGMATIPSPAARTLCDKLRERWKLLEETYKSGETGLVSVLSAAAEYYEAVAVAAESREERRNARQQQVNLLKQLVEVMKTLFRANEVGQADVLATEAELIKAEAQLKRGRIDRDRGRNVPRTP